MHPWKANNNELAETFVTNAPPGKQYIGVTKVSFNMQSISQLCLSEPRGVISMAESFLLREGFICPCFFLGSWRSNFRSRFKITELLAMEDQNYSAGRGQISC